MDYQRTEHKIRRTTRAHGERKQEQEARRNFAHSQRNAPVIADEYALIPMACTCSSGHPDGKGGFKPHYHGSSNWIYVKKVKEEA